jgi:hypothetical protein
MKSTSAAAARIPQIPPGKLQVVVSVVVISVPVVGAVASGVGAGVAGVVGCAVASGAPVVVVGC